MSLEDHVWIIDLRKLGYAMNKSKGLNFFDLQNSPNLVLICNTF